MGDRRKTCPWSDADECALADERDGGEGMPCAAHLPELPRVRVALKRPRAVEAECALARNGETVYAITVTIDGAPAVADDLTIGEGDALAEATRAVVAVRYLTATAARSRLDGHIQTALDLEARRDATIAAAPEGDRARLKEVAQEAEEAVGL